MESISKIYKIGNGPSSSHTMGPKKAAEIFLSKHANAAAFEVTLYGSLGATGVGHLTDVAILSVLGQERTQINWQPTVFLPFHPNGMKFEAFDTTHESIGDWTVFSVGGGEIREENENIAKKESIYEFNDLDKIMEWCAVNGRTYWEYVELHEDKSLWEYLREVWHVMQDAILRGVNNEGVLPGGLGLQRKANQYFVKASSYRDSLRSRALAFAYALATAEENAGGGIIVTAPTCGSSGVLPAVLYHAYKHYDFSEERMLRALATAGLFANIVKENASISGAEVGCQGEIGTACAMAAAAVNQLYGGSIHQIEYAAEMGLEHHLGMTCDPVCGLVQIPCIERNAFAAARALDANTYAMLSDGQHRVSFSRVVRVMKQTGKDLPSLYKETSSGGLANIL